MAKVTDKELAWLAEGMPRLHMLDRWEKLADAAFAELIKRRAKERRR